MIAVLFLRTVHYLINCVHSLGYDVTRVTYKIGIMMSLYSWSAVNRALFLLCFFTELAYLKDPIIYGVYSLNYFELLLCKYDATVACFFQ